MNYLNKIIILLLPLLAARCEVISASISASSYVINEETTYNFKLIRNINPVTFSFISPVTEVPDGSQVLLVMPSQYSTVSTTATPICKDADTSTLLSCSVSESNNTIIVSGFFANSAARTRE